MSQKNYLITGASRGIGHATVMALVEDPQVRVLATARNGDALETLQSATNGLAGTCHCLAFDLVKEDYSSLLDWATQFGEIHGILNNAGLLINQPFREITDADWLRIFTVNLFAPAKLAREFEPHLARGSHLVQIGSMGGFQGSSKFAGLSAYSASKAALANLSECLAEEWKEKGISVNCLALGAVQTEMLAAAFPGYEAPLKSGEMAKFTAWFLQHGGQFFNGKILPVALNNP